MLIPLRDHNPRLRFPVVTLLLIGVNVLVWLYEIVALGPNARAALVLVGGAIPYEIVNHVDLGRSICCRGRVRS